MPKDDKLRSWSGGGGRWAVLVHGGAGTVAPGSEDSHRNGCRQAAVEAGRLLSAGASALDAVQRAVELLELDPQFNAGIGGALNTEGDVELDAAIMEGRSLRAGAVCALRGFPNPVSIARRALEDERHVLYAAEGAARFAESNGFSRVDPASLVTVQARQRLAAFRAGEAGSRGTVGAVALGADGVVAAATSTGGTTGKQPGRVGDSPIVGAGVYADIGGAASATGHGEGILRVALCFRAVSALDGRSEPSAVAERVLNAMRDRVESTGGLILVDERGRLGCACTTTNMSWAAIWEGASGTDGV